VARSPDVSERTVYSHHQQRERGSFRTAHCFSAACDAFPLRFVINKQLPSLGQHSTATPLQIAITARRSSLPSCVCVCEANLRVLTASRPKRPTADARPSPASVQATPCCRPQDPVRRTGARRGLCCQKFPGSCRWTTHVSVLLKTSSHHGVRHHPWVLDARWALRICTEAGACCSARHCGL
jgi:hypothetical protein